MQNKCIPGVSVKEYHPFRLDSAPYKAKLSKKVNSNALTFAYSSEKDFQPLEFCVVSSPHECQAGMPSHCIYENVEYRFRVHAPVKGYLKVENNKVVIVDSFDQASPLNFYKMNPNAALRILYLSKGEPLVFRADSNRQITLQTPTANMQAQWFEITKSSKFQQPMCLDE